LLRKSETMEKIVFKNKGQKIIGYLHKGKTDKTIISLYGLCGHRYFDGELSTRSIEKFVSEGYNVFKFYPRGYLPSEGKFEDETMSERISDLKKAIDFLKKDKVAVFAKSIGAATSILTALQDKRITCMVAVSTAINFENYFDGELKEEVKKKGYYVRRSGKYTKKWYEDLISHQNSDFKNLEIPILFIHGKKDKMVPMKDAKSLFNKIKSKDKGFIEFKNVEHDYLKIEDQYKVIDAAIYWFDKHKDLF